MKIATIIGFLAAIISSFSMMPQVIKVHLTKKTDDLSLGTFTVLALGLFFWFIYGILILEWPVILGNALGLSLTLYIVVMKIRHG